MLIKRGDGKVLSVIQPKDLENVEDEEVTEQAVKQLKQADAKAVKTVKKAEVKN